MSRSVIDQIRTDLVEGIGRYERDRRRLRRSAAVVGSVAVVLAVAVAGTSVWRSAGDGDGRHPGVVLGPEPGPPPPLPGLEALPAPPDPAEGVELSAETLGQLTPVWTGDELLVVGSLEHPTTLDLITVAVAYDPAEREWRDLPPPPVGISQGGAVVWTGDELLVCCGGAPESSAAASYDPRTDAWRTLPDAPVGGYGSAAWIGDRVVVVTATGAAAFDPASGRWSELPSPPGPPPSEYDRFVLLASSDHELYAWPAPLGRTVATGSVLDPATGRWTSLPAPPEAAWPSIPEIVWIDDALVVLGGLPADLAGESERFVAARYDPATGTWSALPEPLPEPQSCECNLGQHASLWTGRDLLVFVSSLASGVSPDGVLLAYDPAEDAWRTVGDTASTALAPVAQLGDRVLLGRGDGLFLSAPGWRPGGV